MRQRWLACRPPRGRLAVALFVVCALAGMVRAASGGSVSEYLGRPVAEIRLESGGAELREQELLDLVETPVGAPLSMTQVRETLAHLVGIGRYQEIQVNATLRGDGVALVYELVPLRHVRRILFRGTLGLNEADLRAAVIERYGASPPVGKAAEAARTLAALYRDHGYPRAAVIPRTEIEPRPERTTLVFDVQCGVRTRIGTIDVQGSPLLPQAQFLDRLNLKPGQPYDRTVIEPRLTQYADELRASGYYEARIEHAAELADDERTANIVVTAEPGSRVTIAFEGDGLTPAEREELVPIAREHSADEDLLEDSKRRIEAYLHDRGYRDSQVDYSRATLDGAVKILFKVRRGLPYTLESVEISGNVSIPIEELRSLIRLKDGAAFVESTLSGDAARIEDAYRRRGFAAARSNVQMESVVAGEFVRAIRARILITEGPRTLIGSIAFEGNTALSAEVLRADMVSQPGQPFYEPQLAVDRDSIMLRYLNLGYESAAVEIGSTFSDDRSAVDLRLAVREGAQVIVDHVLIVGNVRTSAETIEREIQLKPGQPLSLNDLNESQRRLTALGLFRRVRISDLRHPGSETQRDILVTVEEAPATTVGYGGGLEGGKRLITDAEGQAVERFELAPSGFFEVGRRNLWGKNRSLNLFTRVSFRSRGQSVVAANQATGNRRYGFNEYRVLGTYREPRVFGTAADGLVTGFVEQALRSSFNFSRHGARVDMVRLLTSRVSVRGAYSVDRTRLFDEHFSPSEKPLIDRLFPQVRLSAVSASTVRDTRDDPVDPAAGELISVEGELAARGIGSEVGFVKTFFQGFAYRRLPVRRRVIFAAGARVGLSSGFSRDVVRTDDQGQPLIGPDGQPVVDVVKDLPASERFYAGGDTTVRGFALDRLGTSETIGADGFPKGGHSLLVFNAELRIPVWREIGMVGFMDAGNVFAHLTDLDFAGLRGAIGFGLRYRSPIGPIRADLGFKLDRRQFANGEFEKATALHITLGQAF